MPLVFGTGRIGGGWIGIGIAGAAFVVIGAAMLSAGAPAVMLAIGPLLALFAAACATTRVVRIDPAAREVVVTRRLLGISVARRLRLDRFRAVAVTMHIHRPKHSASDGTILGDQIHTHYTVALWGRGAVRLEHVHRPAAPEEGGRRRKNWRRRWLRGWASRRSGTAMGSRMRAWPG
ncbi:hypothetical protein GXW71_03045 [Roseomonas hellenica]|uniref:DUF304 domain-containing protein n=1 Tax=Plastoroseomonas hellenica TaxID=2687306 RepID=A0ABS5ESQ7_9PROT|nr:hypothetical protein [Plastoroseomonas hellenica]MBR0663324.1 hypothetical protein [Plastoroseomonas hellenica]